MIIQRVVRALWQEFAELPSSERQAEASAIPTKSQKVEPGRILHIHHQPIVKPQAYCEHDPTIHTTGNGPHLVRGK